eukprot:g386.t1
MALSSSLKMGVILFVVLNIFAVSFAKETGEGVGVDDADDDLTVFGIVVDNEKTDLLKEIVRIRFFPQIEYLDIDLIVPQLQNSMITNEIVRRLRDEVQNIARKSASGRKRVHAVVVVGSHSGTSKMSVDEEAYGRFFSRIEASLGEVLQELTVSVSIFVSDKGEGAETSLNFYGDPRSSVEYGDRGGFNRALTLRAYLQQDDGKRPPPNLQNLFLQFGLFARVFFLDALQLCTPSQHALNPLGCSRVAEPLDMVLASFKSPLDRTSQPPVERKHLLPPILSPLRTRGDTLEADARSECENDDDDVAGEQKDGQDRTCDASLAKKEASSSLAMPTCAMLDRKKNTQPPTPFASVPIASLGDVNDGEILTPEKIVANGYPVLLKSDVVRSWNALNAWKHLDYLRKKIEEDEELIVTRVKVGDGSGDGTSFTLNDNRWPQASTIAAAVSKGFDDTNMSTSELFDTLLARQKTSQNADPSNFIQAFAELPFALEDDVSPASDLFGSHEDREKSMRFLWLSSPGTTTHWHVDQDHNFFAQIVGRKRFTIVPGASFRSMYLYPRLSPLWHKSQVHARCPDLDRFPEYADVRPLVAEVEPGDVLYIPALTFHNVETLDAATEGHDDGGSETHSYAISVSSWTHNMTTYDIMDGIYGIELVVDRIKSVAGRAAALRMYLDVLTYELVAHGSSSEYFHRLLEMRYTQVDDLGRKHSDGGDGDDDLMPWLVYFRGNLSPISHSVYQDIDMDVRIVGKLFRKLSSVSRDLFLQNYVEEVIEDALGIDRVLPFIRSCFLPGTGYYLTEKDSEDHRVLWQQK